jgi:hypothetical protein
VPGWAGRTRDDRLSLDALLLNRGIARLEVPKASFDGDKRRDGAARGTGRRESRGIPLLLACVVLFVEWSMFAGFLKQDEFQN